MKTREIDIESSSRKTKREPFSVEKKDPQIILWKVKRCFYCISSNNSRPTINHLPQIIAPFDGYISSNNPPPPPKPLAIVSAGTPITVNLEVEAEVESDSAKRISDDSSFDAEYIDIENYPGTRFGTL